MGTGPDVDSNSTRGLGWYWRQLRRWVRVPLDGPPPI